LEHYHLELLVATFPEVYDSSANYGFKDSANVNPQSADYQKVSSRFSALAQQWIFLSIVNRETGFIWEYFYKNDGVRKAHNDLFLLGDLDNNEAIDVSDAILGLQVVGGITPERVREDYTNSDADVNGDHQIGLEETIFCLRRTAGID
jgi:hypothetical protein